MHFQFPFGRMSLYIFVFPCLRLYTIPPPEWRLWLLRSLPHMIWTSLIGAFTWVTGRMYLFMIKMVILKCNSVIEPIGDFLLLHIFNLFSLFYKITSIHPRPRPRPWHFGWTQIWAQGQVWTNVCDQIGLSVGIPLIRRERERNGGEEVDGGRVQRKEGLRKCGNFPSFLPSFPPS